MSSVTSATAYTKQGAAYFVNILTITVGTDTFTEAGVTTSPSGLTGSYTIGTLLVKDMGKTVHVGTDVFRKVQVANVTNADATTQTFYIKLLEGSNQTCSWASVTRPY